MSKKGLNYKKNAVADRPLMFLWPLCNIRSRSLLANFTLEKKFDANFHISMQMSISGNRLFIDEKEVDDSLYDKLQTFPKYSFSMKRQLIF